MPFLPINKKTFGFVQREKIKGKTQKNKCGRDFLYYCLNYYYPQKFNSKNLNPLEIERKRIFGYKISPFFAWTSLQFVKIPKSFNQLDLELQINGRKIHSFSEFLISMCVPNRRSVKETLEEIESAIKNKCAIGIDIALDKTGLFDHVMFVYGYDKDNIYVFDTHQVPGLEYEKMTKDNRFIMKLPKRILSQRWALFSRVWKVSKNPKT
jgi:hypothetical protein